MNSDAFICITDISGEDKKLIIVDLKNRTPPVTHKIGAQAAVMHPTAQIVALKGLLRGHSGTMSF